MCKSITIELDAEPALDNFCWQHGILYLAILQFAWTLVLRCYTASGEVCFGYVTLSRDMSPPNI